MEGDTEEQVMPVLVAKITPHSQAPVVLNLHGRGNVLSLDSVRRHVAVARQANPSIEKVLVCVDSECTDVDDTRRIVAPLQRRMRKLFPHLAVTYVVVDHSIEGWLLGDREALQRVLGSRSHLTDYSDPENHCRPAELIAEVFRRNGKRYNKIMHGPRLAEALDAKHLARSSDTFRVFQQALRSALSRQP